MQGNQHVEHLAPHIAHLARIEQQWNRFAANPNARLLHWIIDPKEWPTFESFLRAEEQNCLLEDIIVRPPFEFRAQHGFLASLRPWLLEHLAHIAIAFEDAGAPAAEWCPPPQRDGDDANDLLLATLSSFRAHFAPLFRRLAIAIPPALVKNHPAYMNWLSEVLRRNKDENVRFVVFDYRGSVALGPLTVDSLGSVWTLDTSVPIPESAEVVANPPELFRVTFHEMLAASTGGDDARAEELLELSVGLARGARAWQLEYSAYFGYATARLERGNALAAVHHYRVAQEIAFAAALCGAEHAHELRIEAKRAVASACDVAGLSDEAAAEQHEVSLLATGEEPRTPRRESGIIELHSDRQPVKLRRRFARQ